MEIVKKGGDRRGAKSIPEAKVDVSVAVVLVEKQWHSRS